jgi:membrane protease YdiL (CAAX protease family)
MLTATPLLNNKTPFIQLLVLLLLILSSTLLTFFVGILLAMPFYGTGVIEILIDAGDLSTSQDIALMKYFQFVNQLGLFIIPTMVFSLLASANIFSYLKLNRRPASISLIITILLLFSILPIIHWLVEINEGLHLPDFLGRVEEWMRSSEKNATEITEAFLSTTSLSGLLVNILIVGVFAAVGEELLFRSVLIRLLDDWFKNVHLAVLVSALLFSAFHLQFFGFLPRFFLGLVFGYLFVWSGSLWLPILAHFVNNASAVIVYFLANTGHIQTDAEQFGATENIFLLIFSIFVSSGLLALIFFTERKKHSLPAKL